jgi:hypothetical protein
VAFDPRHRHGRSVPVRNGTKDKGFASNWMERVEPEKPSHAFPEMTSSRCVANQAEK